MGWETEWGKLNSTPSFRDPGSFPLRVPPTSRAWVTHWMLYIWLAAKETDRWSLEKAHMLLTISGWKWYTPHPLRLCWWHRSYNPHQNAKEAGKHILVVREGRNLARLHGESGSLPCVIRISEVIHMPPSWQCSCGFSTSSLRNNGYMTGMTCLAPLHSPPYLHLSVKRPALCWRVISATNRQY